MVYGSLLNKTVLFLSLTNREVCHWSKSQQLTMLFLSIHQFLLLSINRKIHSCKISCKSMLKKPWETARRCCLGNNHMMPYVMTASLNNWHSHPNCGHNSKISCTYILPLKSIWHCHLRSKCTETFASELNKNFVPYFWI